MMRLLSFAVLTAVPAALAAPAALQAQTKEHAPTALPSAPKMTQDKPQSESWTYFRPAVDFSKYKTLMVDPTAVYKGADAQFNDVPSANRDKFASYLTDALRTELAKSFTLVNKPGPDTLRLKLTLLGVEVTKGGVATATRVVPLGFVTSAVKSLAGKEGTFTGSVLLAIEATNGASGELEAAAVRRHAPDALDIPATLSTDDTVKAVARDVAKRVRERLEQRRAK